MDQVLNRAKSGPLHASRVAALTLAERLETIGLFPRQVKALRCCGLPLASAPGSRPIRCNLPFCPECLPRWRTRTLATWSPRIKQLHGPEGGAVMLVLTTGRRSDPLREQKTRLKDSVTRVFRSRAWRGRQGHGKSCGCLVTLEFTQKENRAAAPHLHVLMVASKLEEGVSAAMWLRESWLHDHPESRPDGQFLECCQTAQDALRWFNYSLKGDLLDPRWNNERLEEAAIALLNCGFRLRAFGRLARALQ